MPPALWRRIAVLLQDRDGLLVALKGDALRWANRTVAGVWRTYSIAGRVVQVEPSPGGDFPIVEYTRGISGDWQLGFWTRLPEAVRALPAGTLAYRLTHEGQEPADPVVL